MSYNEVFYCLTTRCSQRCRRFRRPRLLSVTGDGGKVGNSFSSASVCIFFSESGVVIMIDVSYSMFTRTGDAEGGKLLKKGNHQSFQTVRDEATRLVQSLGPNIQFGIVRWAGSARSWKPDLIPATDENKRAAIEHI